MKDVVGSLSDPTHHSYDSETIEFLNSVGYVGEERAVKLLVGPMSKGQGAQGKGHFDPTNIKGNLYGPSKSTRNKLQSGYTTESGLYSPPLLQTFLMLAQNSLIH